MTNTSKIEDLARDKEYEAFKSAVGNEKDHTMMILRAHLYSENLLDRIISSLLPRGDRIIENGSLTYAQKVNLVDALDRLPDELISSLKNLNKIRNQCAHELSKEITEADVTRIGSPLGKRFSEIKRKSEFNVSAILRRLILSICAGIGGYAFQCEHGDAIPAEAEGQTQEPKTSRKRVKALSSRKKPDA